MRVLARRKLETVRAIVAGCSEAARQYDAPPSRVWSRFLRLYARRFSPREIFLWGLLDPELTARDLCEYVSKESLLRIQRHHNPASYANLVEDKVVFHAQCTGLGLPVPRALAIFTRGGGWLLEEGSCMDCSALVQYVKGLEEKQFILKPAAGVYGHGVRLFGRNADRGWTDQGGNAFDERSLVDYFREQSAYDRFLIQERIHNHHQIAELTGVSTLQTVRVISVAGDDGAPGEILLANWRIAGRQGVTDNFDYGQGGSLLADVDVTTGRIRRVVGPKRDGNGIEEIHTHPVTDASLQDFTLPHWKSVRDVIHAATVRFAPLRLVGWDVALAEDGPVLIEANARFDAGQNAFRGLPTLIRRLNGLRAGEEAVT